MTPPLDPAVLRFRLERRRRPPTDPAYLAALVDAKRMYDDSFAAPVRGRNGKRHGVLTTQVDRRKRPA